MTDRPEYELIPEEEGAYRVAVPSKDGMTTFRLRMDDAPAVSDGRLGDDEASAHAVVAFLLDHQDAVDLPPIVEIEEVVAAYAGAVDEILARRN